MADAYHYQAFYGWNAGMTQAGRLTSQGTSVTLFIGGFGTVFPLPAGTFGVDILENGIKIATLTTAGTDFQIKAGNDYQLRVTLPGAAVKYATIKGRVVDTDGNPVGSGTVTWGVDTGFVAYDGSYTFGTDRVGQDHVIYHGVGYEDVDYIMQIHKDVNVADFVTRATGAVSPPVSPPGVTPTAQKQAWIDFWSNPIISAIAPASSMSSQESMSKVFGGWSIIDDAPAVPSITDYIATGAILAGISAAGIITFFQFLPVIAGSGGAVTTADLINWLDTSGAPAAIKIAESGNIQASADLIGQFFAKTAGLAPAAAPTIFSRIAADFAAHPLLVILGGSMLVSQMDVSGWGFGLLPQNIYSRSESTLKSIRADLINLEKYVKAKDWTNAKKLADNIDIEISQVRSNFEGAPATFWTTFGFTQADGFAMLASLETTFNSYRNQYGALSTGFTPSSADTTISNVDVYDGDTLKYSGHPEANNSIRFAGMDAHEAGTVAGEAETSYLKSLIQGKTIVLKIDPVNILDQYGRLLGVPYLDGVNVVHLMLAKFGPTIIGTKYKNKYVDYDQEKRIANGEEAVGGGGVPTPPAAFKLYIDSVPTNSKLFIDGIAAKHNTPSDEKELKDVMNLLTPGQHTFKATRAGMEGTFTTILTSGDNGRISIPLATIGLPPTTPPATGTLDSRVASLEKMLASIAAKLGV